MGVWYKSDSVLKPKPLQQIAGRVDDVEAGLMDVSDQAAETSDGVMELADILAATMEEINAGLIELADEIPVAIAEIEARVSALENTKTKGA